MKTNPVLLKLEAVAMPDPKFILLAKALSLAMATMPANPSTAFLDDCRMLDIVLNERGAYLASLN